jgi:2-methylcitrate dehydratase
MAPVKDQSVAKGFAGELVAQFTRFAAMTDRDAIVLRLADTAACAMGAESLVGAADNTVSRIAKFSAQGSDSREATIWATGEKQSVDTVAFRNAVSARYLDLNDTFIGSTIVHPSDMIPAIVALAESRAIPWPRVIEAIGVAYETLCRAAEQAKLGPHGLDNSSLTPLATAAGCGWLIDLDAQQAANALKLVVLDSATLRCVRRGHLSEWKAVASPRGTIKALFAVRMAELGTSAPEVAFEDSDGFLARVSGPLSFASDERPRLCDTVLKQYPSQIFTQAMIEMAREINAQRAGKPIASVTIRTFDRAVEMVGGDSKAGGHGLNRETADHSAAFCVAAMLARGRLGYRDFEPFLGDADVLGLMSRVRVVDIGQAANAYPKTQASELEVELTDGSRLTAWRTAPPVADAAMLQAKLNDLWPASRERDWPWQLPGQAPAFPSPSAGAGGPMLAKAEVIE